MKTMCAILALMCMVTTAAAAGELHDDLLALEKSGWAAWAKGDGKFFLENLTEDSVQIVAGTGMMVGREAIAAEVSKGGCDVKGYDFADAKVRRLGKDVAVLSYTATQDATCDGIKLPAKVYSSAIYVMKDGKWRSASYQETPAE